MDVIDIIALVAPEFKNTSESIIMDMIELTRPLVSKKQFGNLYNQALALLVCHRLKMYGYGDDVGSDSDDGSFGSVANAMRVASYSEGSRSVSFGGASGMYGAADTEYEYTPYGKQFINLRMRAVIPITIAGVDKIV